MQINEVMFTEQLTAFLDFVTSRNGVAFNSFAQHPYIRVEENYKYKVRLKAEDALDVNSWKKDDVGSGKILDASINCIELPMNNLVPWQSRWGDDARPHRALYEARDNGGGDMRAVEALMYSFFRSELSDEDAFQDLLSVFGRKYAILAYLFFVKDSSSFMPIQTRYFDESFSRLGVAFKTTQKCSWENYITYNGLLGQVKKLLSQKLETEVTLLDAHSFCWIMVMQMKDFVSTQDGGTKLILTEREAVAKARIGQGVFRDDLIKYWGYCAVTNCHERSLLIASHIKPWKIANNSERLNSFNGLLLSPTLDKCFDKGFVSFDDSGEILISKRLSAVNRQALKVTPDLRLRKVDGKHKPFLAYHRDHVFL